MELTNINTIKDLMRRHGMNFSKSLGQNFLINPSVCPEIAELGSVTPEIGVLEIGPGIGVLTKELAKSAKKVVAIELDKRLLPILAETLADFNNIKVIQGDVLELNLHQLLEDEFPQMDVVVCANLPYYITTPIIMRFLEEKLPIKSITAMVQREAAQRICAPIPSREVGGVTISIAYYAETEILFGVSKDSFLPAPNVESSVIKLHILSEPKIDVKNETDFFRVVKAAFCQRRKTISNSLSSGLALDKAAVNQLLDSVEISSKLRAEQLTLEEFAKIASGFSELSS